jgi:hypothetical protein
MLFVGTASITASIAASVAIAEDEFEDRGSKDGKGEAEAGRFEPYFNSGPYTTIQRVKGDLTTSFGPSSKPRNTLTNMGWLFEIGVAAPAIKALPGAPRLNLFAGLLVPTNESSVIQTTLVKTLVVPGETPGFDDAGQLAEGTKMALEYQNSYRAGLGAEFTLPFFDLDLTLMPGVQYLYLGSRYTGQVNATFVASVFPEPPLPSLDFERTSSAQNSLVQHLLGPSLKIGTEEVSFGPFLLDLYIEGSLLFDVAGTRRQSTFVDAEGGTSVFTWEAGTTAGVFNAGFRVRIP